MLTICYVTYRRDPILEWFFESLYREAKGDFRRINVIVVDHHQPIRTIDCKEIPFKHVWTKPSVWQGPYRLTREEYFSASNARNTGLCHAPDGWIAYVDDLSVLMPGWLMAVCEAMAGNYIALGAYKKVKKLDVRDGLVRSCEEFPAGVDSRWPHGNDEGPVVAGGRWMYGCSVVMPVESLLTINGWPEDLCDGCGGEDYCCGIALANNGYPFRYDRRMLTYESEEHHHGEKPFKRADYGKSPEDKSHKALSIAEETKYFTQSFGSIRTLRQRILAGGDFPIPTEPSKEWFTGIPLGNLP